MKLTQYIIQIININSISNKLQELQQRIKDTNAVNSHSRNQTNNIIKITYNTVLNYTEIRKIEHGIKVGDY